MGTSPTPTWSSTPSSWRSSDADPTSASSTTPTRGSAYTSLAFGQRLETLGITASFGSTGDGYDSAAVESTWATLKRQLAWIHRRQT
ncbi:hypothetical protein [Nocardioides daphniae]|nr:hypothetical protein [Nocardioides daphniae]